MLNPYWLSMPALMVSSSGTAWAASRITMSVWDAVKGDEVWLFGQPPERRAEIVEATAGSVRAPARGPAHMDQVESLLRQRAYHQTLSDSGCPGQCTPMLWSGQCR